VIYAVLFEDDVHRSEMRAKHMPDHLAFLERNAAIVHAAGPLKDIEGDVPVARRSRSVLAHRPAQVGPHSSMDPRIRRGKAADLNVVRLSGRNWRV